MKILTNAHVSYSKPQFKKQKSLLNFQQHIKGKSFNKLESMQKKAVWQCENTLTYRVYMLHLYRILAVDLVNSIMYTCY